MLEQIMNQSLEEIFYMTFSLFYIVGMVAVFTGVPLIFLFWKRWMPKASRTLFWAGRRKTPPLLLVHDSGRGELTTIHERKGEGIVMTAQGKYKILPRWLPKIPLSQMMARQETLTQQAAAGDQPALEDASAPADQTTTQETAGFQEVDLHKIFNVKVLKDNFILDYSDWIVKRTNLVGLDLPFFVGYTGKLCLLNPEALALYEAGDMMIKTEDHMMFNPNGVEGKDPKNAMQPLQLLDARRIQQIIYEGFDQSQIAAVVADSEELARIGQGMSPKLKLLLAVVVIGVVAAAALFLLPQFLGQQQQQGTPPPALTAFIRHLFRK